jgi:GT2 family glycosyltransferase
MSEARLEGVSIVMLTYNRRDLLEIALPSLAAQSHAPLETLGVQNGSRHDSLSYLAEHWPGIVVVAIPQNVGVPAAINRGFQAARGDLVALINNDLEFERGWLEHLVDGATRYPHAGSFACKLRSYRERDRLDGAGDALNTAITPYRRGSGELDHGQYDREEEVFAPTAGAALYRAETLDDVGPYDESFFAYYEDVDWGLRAQLAGHRCVYIPSAVGYHMGSATTGGTTDPFYYSLHRRNLLALAIKDLPASVLLRHARPIGRELAGALVHSAKNGLLKAHLRALSTLPRVLPGWLAARRRIQGARRVPARRIDWLLGEEIS